MRNALVIDDMDCRHEGFRRIFADPKWGLTEFKLHHAFTASEAITMIREARFPHAVVSPPGPDGRRKITEPEPFDWDLIFLDHDCDEQEGPDFIEVVRFIGQSPELIRNRPVFFIHSHNPVGCTNMRDDLVRAGHRVVIKPFDVPGCNWGRTRSD